MTERTVREVPTSDGRTMIELTGPTGFILGERGNRDATIRTRNPVDLTEMR